MSADNFIGVYRKGDKYYVGEGCMSILEEDCQYRTYKNPKKYPNRNGALVAAHDMYRDYSIVEYGVIELDDLPQEWCGRCLVCIMDRDWIAEDVERCTKCNRPFTNSDWRSSNGTTEGWIHNYCEERILA